MLTILSVLAVSMAAPGEASSLKLNRIHTTYCVLGPARTSDSYLPGDSFVLAFDIEGLTVAADGKVQYTTAIQVADSAGKVLYKQDPRTQEAVNALGGGTLPAYVKLDIGVQQPPGQYTLELSVADPAGKQSQTLSRTVTVLPPGFGLVRLRSTTDAEGNSPAAALAAGQSLWVGAGVVGFARNATTQQPHLRLTLRVLDESGKPTVEKPFVGGVEKDIAANALSVPARFYLSLNRPGKFTVELEAADLIANKKATLSFPIHVQATK